MEKIIMAQGYGKTTQLIIKSSMSGDVIVCQSFQEVKRIHGEALKMWLIIPMPITYKQFIDREYRDVNGFLIDNVEYFLQDLSNVEIRAITLCP